MARTLEIRRRVRERSQKRGLRDEEAGEKLTKRARRDRTERRERRVRRSRHLSEQTPREESVAIDAYCEGVEKV